MEEKRLIPQLALLCELQELDLQIRRIKENISEIPTKIAKWRGELAEREGKLEELKKGREQRIVARKEKELDLDSKQDNLKKYQAQLYMTKTNKEYSSLLHEIEEVKRVSSRLEDDILISMEEVEAQEESIQKKSNNLEEKRQETQKGEQEENAKSKELEERLEVTQAERNKLAQNVDSSLLSKYERIAKGKAGLAIVPVVDETCGGCHLQLPPQSIQIVKQGDKFTTCEGCARILYWEENVVQLEK